MTGGRRIRLVMVAAGVALLLSGCGPKTRWDHTPRTEHVVRTGETLYAIAWRYGKDEKELARWNTFSTPKLWAVPEGSANRRARV